MNLVRIAKLRWDVLAILDARGHCPVLEFLADLQGPQRFAAEQMLALLRQQIPANGPPKGEPLCKCLGNGLYELRRQPKGKKLRVVWFYGGGAVIVCAAAFTKAERTPRTEIERAKQASADYWHARARSELRIVEL
jgi:phage-related protein